MKARCSLLQDLAQDTFPIGFQFLFKYQPEHLPCLVVSQTGVGTVHDDHKLDPGQEFCMNAMSQLLKHIVLYCYVGSPCVRYIAKYFLVLTGVKSSKVKFPVQCNKNVLYTEYRSQCYKRLALTKYV